MYLILGVVFVRHWCLRVQQVWTRNASWYGSSVQ